MSKDFTIDNIEKTGLQGYVNSFSIDYHIIDANDVLDINKYLMKITIILSNIMFEFIEEMFIGLLMFGGSLVTRCMTLNNKQCKIFFRPFRINLNPVKFKYYSFMINDK